MTISFIAELCQNHNGDFDNVLKMVDSAAEGGATHIKIQHIYSSQLVYRPQFEMGLQDDNRIHSIQRPWLTEYKRLKSLELTNNQCEKFVEYVKSIGLIPLTTCFARESIGSIVEQGFENIKVASYDCASYQLIKELAEKFKHLYVSTGATHADEIEFAAKLLKDNAIEFSLLHCVTIYPTPLNMMNLARIKWLKQYTNNVGFSDHSLVSRDKVIAAKASIFCGAKIIERHFTIYNPSSTKDGPVSINKEDLQSILQFSELSKTDQEQYLNEHYGNWKDMIGNPDRDLSDQELLNRDYYRGRFASPRNTGDHRYSSMIMNWEETQI